MRTPFGWLDILRQDIRYGARQLRLSPGFAFAAILSLALGIGANTAIFTLVDQVLLRLLPVSNPRELVQFKSDGGRVGSQSGDGVHTFSHPLYVAFRDRNTVFTGLTGQRLERASLVEKDRSEMVGVGMVGGNFFQVLGVRPHLGRLLTADDDRNRNAHPVAVLQYDFWQTRFAGNPAMVGATIRINGSPFTVIGVAAPDFEGTDVGLPTQMWAPVMMKPTITPTWDALDDERNAWFYLFARLKPGVSREQAQAAMQVVFDQRKQEELQLAYFQKYPEDKDRLLRQKLELIPAERGQSNIRGRFEKPLLVLQWLVSFVLLIACTNVANLLLARAAARQREVAIRSALGASRGQIVRQFFVESLLLAITGGVAGLVLSGWIAKGLVRFLPVDPANLSLLTTPDLRVLFYTTGLTLLTAIVFGLVPAMQGSRVSPGTTLKEEAGAIAGGHAHVRLRKLFVGLQVGLSCLLLIGAGLFTRTLRNLQDVDLGFRTENVAMFNVRPATVYEPARKLQVFRKLLESLPAVHGVRSAGANSTTLLTGGRWDSTITMPGVQGQDGRPPWSFFNAITPGYFETLGIPVKAGRDLRWDDWGSARKVCLVNEALVKEYLGDSSPLGRVLAQGSKNTPDTEIIGVFGDAKYHDVRGVVPRQTFLNLDGRMEQTGAITVYARMQGDPRQILPMIREQVRRVDPNLVISDMRMLDEQLERRLANERMLSFLSAGFAVLASLLALIGLHGVLAFVVARRSHEIGIRMALGAEQGRVIRLVMSEMLLVIVCGIAAGVVTGIACGRYVETQLFGVKAGDVAVYAISASVLLTAALAAAFVPAWRASRIDPMRALRHD
ncbi:MAG: ABC transporter permease [Bryobacterales bacterium]|nr:ABC transporter permease [Bryobacterales bacterium]